jgi:hypothetical protein
MKTYIYMSDAKFKESLLKFGGIDAAKGTLYLRGNTRMLGDGSYMSQLTVRDMVVTGNAVIPGISFDSLTVAGNVVSTDGNFIGNGALMTGVISTLPVEANIDIIGNVAGVYANVGQIIAISGNIGNVRMVGGNVSASGQVNIRGNVVARGFIGNGARLDNVKVSGTQNIDIVGNVKGEYVNVVEIIAISGSVGGVLMENGNVGVSGQVDVLGNVAAEYFTGNGALLTGILPKLPSNANIDIKGNLTGAYANVGNVNASAGNIGNVRMAGGNVSVRGQVNVVGNVTAGYFVGNGALLNGIPINLPTIANIDIRGNVTGEYVDVGNVTAISGNIGDVRMSKGNVSVSGQVNVVGNVTAGYFVGNGALLNGIPIILPTIANIDIRGNVTGEYADVGNVTAISGNIGDVRMSKGNVSVRGQVNVVGNVAAGYFIGSGELLTGILTKLPAIANIDIKGNLTGSNVTATVGNVGGVLMEQGNITANIGNVGGVLMEQGNITANIGNVGGVVIDGGTVTARNFVGSGALLTGITPYVAYLSAGRITPQASSGNWTDTVVLFDKINAQSGIIYTPTNGVFRLSKGTSYRITAQLNWEAKGQYSFPFYLYDVTAGEAASISAENISMSSISNFTASPVLDVIITPSSTFREYCIKIGSTGASSGEKLRNDIGTFLTIVMIGRAEGSLSDQPAISAPLWTKVFNWDFGGTIAAPTSGVSAKREYSWSATGGTLNMKGYYISESSDGATAGDGEYVLEIPPGYTIDPTIIATPGTTEGIPVGQLTLHTASTQGTGVVLVHDSTHLKFATGLAGSGPIAVIGSTFAPLNADAYSLYFSADVPIL